MMTCQRALQSLSQSHRFLWRSALDGTTVIPQVVTSQKAKKTGDDIISPQIKDAVSKVLSALGKKK
jgi:hypothetical protein